MGRILKILSLNGFFIMELLRISTWQHVIAQLYRFKALVRTADFLQFLPRGAMLARNMLSSWSARSSVRLSHADIVSKQLN